MTMKNMGRVKIYLHTARSNIVAGGRVPSNGGLLNMFSVFGGNGRVLRGRRSDLIPIIISSYPRSHSALSDPLYFRGSARPIEGSARPIIILSRNGRYLNVADKYRLAVGVEKVFTLGVAANVHGLAAGGLGKRGKDLF